MLYYICISVSKNRQVRAGRPAISCMARWVRVYLNCQMRGSVFPKVIGAIHTAFGKTKPCQKTVRLHLQAGRHFAVAASCCIPYMTAGECQGTAECSKCTGKFAKKLRLLLFLLKEPCCGGFSCAPGYAEQSPAGFAVWHNGEICAVFFLFLMIEGEVCAFFRL